LHRGYLREGHLSIEGITTDRVPNPVAHLDLFPWGRTYIYLPSYCL